MSEFSLVDRKREMTRKKRIEDIIRAYLEQQTRITRCAQCNVEFTPLVAMGRRECVIHPLQVNTTMCHMERHTKDDFSSTIHDHYACCGTHASGVSCNYTPRIDLVRGCLKADHSTRNSTSTSYLESTRIIAIDARNPMQGLARYVHIEPLFIVRKLANIRGIDLGTAEGRTAFFGTTSHVVVSDYTRIGANRQELVALRAGPFRFEIDIRSVYLTLLQRYGLPHNMVQQNFVKHADSGIDRSSLAVARRVHMHAILSKAFAGVTEGSANARQWGTSIPDTISVDRNGRVLNADGGIDNANLEHLDAIGASASVDEYYDVDKVMCEVRPHSHSVPSTSSSSSSSSYALSAESMARELIASVASTDDAFTFYPFAIWSWLDDEYIHLKPALPHAIPWL